MNDVWNFHGIMWPSGIPIGQSWLDIGAIFYSIQTNKPKTFIEIGINQGGLAALMYSKTVIETDFHYFGIELYGHVIDTRLPKSNGNFTIYVGDVFNNVGWMASAIGSSGKTLIFCDGGDKVKEMELVAPLMRPQDIILVHDYTKDWTDAEIPPILEQIKTDWLLETHLWMGKLK